MPTDRLRYIRNQDIIASWIDNELVMISVQTGKYYTMNKTAALIWDLMETPKSQENIVDMMLQRFNVDIDVCTAEVNDCIKTLLNKSLISSVKHD